MCVHVCVCVGVCVCGSNLLFSSTCPIVHRRNQIEEQKKSVSLNKLHNVSHGSRPKVDGELTKGGHARVDVVGGAGLDRVTDGLQQLYR
jgi:hypothetical protein